MGKQHLWAHLYANPACWLCLKVIAARYPADVRSNFLEAFSKHFNQLKRHVERLKTAKPLVTAAMLKECGIVPGKKMGLLLKEAEKIAINEDIHDENIVMQCLLQHSLWKMS